MQMQLSIIARLQDRASRGLRALFRVQKQHERLQKAYGNATARAARQQAELARAGNRTARAMSSEASAAARLRAALERVNAMIRKQVSLRERLRRAGSLAREGAGRIGRAAALGAGIYGTVQGLAASAASLVVGPAAQMEKFQTVLETTEGSAAKAKKALAWITKFAVTTPYELNEVTEAFVQLRAYGLDPTNGLLRTLGDTAAAMNKPIMQAVEAIADAVTGENERLKEFGIKARAAGKYFYYEYTENGVTKVAKALKSNRAQIQKVLTGIFQAKYGGAMEKLSRTWNGMVSNMADMWFKFRLMVAHSGVFEWLKSKLAFLLETFNKLEAAGRLQEIARQIGASIIQGLKALWQFGLGVWAVLKRVGAALEWAADKLGGWNNLAMLLMAIPLVNVFASAASGVMLLGRALLVLAANPMTLLIGALAAAAAYLIDWPAVIDAARGAWARLKAALGNVDLAGWAASARAALGAFFGWLSGLGSSWLSGLRTGLGDLSALGARLRGIWDRLAAAGRHLAAAFAGMGGNSALHSLLTVLGRLAGLTLRGLITALDWLARGIELLAAGAAHAVAAGREFIAFWAGVPDRIGAAWQAFKGWLAQPFDPFPGVRQKVQAVIATLTALPQQAVAVVRRAAAALGSFNPMAHIRAIDWLGLLQRGLNTAIEAVRAAFAGLNLGTLLKPLQWSGIVLARLGGAINQLIARFSGLDIGTLIRGVDWLGLLQRGLNTAIEAVRAAFARLNLFEAGVKVLQSFWAGLKSVMSGLAGWVKKKLSGIFTLPSWARGWFGGNKQPAAQVAAQPQARATGGPFGRGPLLVGERGPELLYASRAGWVAHNDNLQRIIGLSRRAAASIAAVSLASHVALAPPRIEPATPPARLLAASAGQQVATRGGQQVTVHYAPQVTVQGAAGAEDVQAALDAHLDRLLDALQRRQRERERLEF